jgi:hypothetical protein
MMSENAKRFTVLVGIVFIGIISRLVPHVANVAPITAIALFAGAYFLDKKWGMIIPLLALFLSDCILQAQFLIGKTEYPGFYKDMVFVYGAFALIVGLGYLLKNRVTVLSVFGATLGASAIFYLVTNFGVWAATSASSELFYPKTLSGLLLCYEAGIPFALRTLGGDLIFTGLLFGVFEFLVQSNQKNELSPIKVKSK